MHMFITTTRVLIEVALRDMEPHEAEMILSDYKREVGEFKPASVQCSWSQLSSAEILWPSAEVSGRRTIKRGALARVLYSEDDNGETGHWPQYVKDAFLLARSKVQ